jgi:hypothetical protein
MLNKDQVNAALRHVYTVVGALVAFAVAMGLLGAQDADTIVRLVNEIGTGVAAIVGAIAALVPIISAARAAWSASHSQQIKKVEAMPDVTVRPLTAKGAELIDKALAK